MSGPNIKILISCHKETEYFQNSIMTPILIGAMLSGKTNENMLRDDTGDNITEKNLSYCELTAQYWAWKNVEADYYGLCHYRRYFNFSEYRYPQDSWGMVREQRLNADLSTKYGWDEESIKRSVIGADIITTPNFDVRAFPGHYRSVYEHYKAADILHIKDIDTLLEIIRDKYSDYYQDALEYINGRKSRFCNMFIMKRDIFFDYCKWLFDILSEFENRTDMSSYSKQALRTPGHLAERLLNIYLIHLKRVHPNIRIKEIQAVLFSDTEPLETLSLAFPQKRSIPVVLASSDLFAPIVGVCLKSIIAHSTSDNSYDIIILETDISNYNKKLLADILRSYENFSLRFYNVKTMLEGHRLKPSEHVGVETYYRFLIPDILPEVDKVLYLDSDLIVLADVADLYLQDLNDNLVAAVRDPDFQGQVNMPNSTMKQYACEELKIKNPYNYFQAGVLLLNLTEMRALHSSEEWLYLASTPHRYADQDVLNQCCQGRVKYLDLSWNVLTDCDWKRVSDIIEFAPATLFQEYMEARKNPKIVHFAGFKKPWQFPGEDFGELFWKYARQTPFYELLLYRMTKGKFYKAKQSTRLRCLADWIFPKGSYRRFIVKKYFLRK